MVNLYLLLVIVKYQTNLKFGKKNNMNINCVGRYTNLCFVVHYHSLVYKLKHFQYFWKYVYIKCNCRNNLIRCILFSNFIFQLMQK